MSDRLLTYEPDGGEPIRIGSLGDLPAGLARKNRRESDEVRMWDAIEALAGSEDVERIDALTQDEFVEFQKWWVRESGVGIPE